MQSKTWTSSRMVAFQCAERTDVYCFTSGTRSCSVSYKINKCGLVKKAKKVLFQLSDLIITLRLVVARVPGPVQNGPPRFLAGSTRVACVFSIVFYEYVGFSYVVLDLVCSDQLDRVQIMPMSRSQSPQRPVASGPVTVNFKQNSLCHYIFSFMLSSLVVYHHHHVTTLTILTVYDTIQPSMC